MSKPLSYSGIETAGKSSLFFKSRAGKLVQLVEQGRDQKYTKNTVKLGGSELKIGGDSFAAVSYTDTEKTEQVSVIISTFYKALRPQRNFFLKCLR
jgi:hypothetical protein